MSTDDVSAIQDYLSGDKEAFGILMGKYKADIYARVYKKLGNAEDAEDVMQEVFVRAYCGLSGLDHYESFRTWLRRIADNECNNWIRERSRRRGREDEFIKRWDRKVLDELSLNTCYDIELAQNALDSLSEIDREVLVLRFYGDMRVEDMAGALGVTPDTIRSRLHRAMKRLRDKYIELLEISKNMDMLRYGHDLYERWEAARYLVPLKKDEIDEVLMAIMKDDNWLTRLPVYLAAQEAKREDLLYWAFGNGPRLGQVEAAGCLGIIGGYPIVRLCRKILHFMRDTAIRIPASFILTQFSAKHFDHNLACSLLEVLTESSLGDGTRLELGVELALLGHREAVSVIADPLRKKQGLSISEPGSDPGIPAYCLAWAVDPARRSGILGSYISNTKRDMQLRKALAETSRSRLIIEDLTTYSDKQCIGECAKSNGKAWEADSSSNGYFSEPYSKRYGSNGIPDVLVQDIVKLDGIWTLANLIGDERACDALAELLNSPNWFIQHHAKLALDLVEARRA